MVTSHLDWRRVIVRTCETDGELQRWAKLIFNNTVSSVWASHDIASASSICSVPETCPYLLSQDEQGSAEKCNTLRHRLHQEGEKWHEKWGSGNSWLLWEWGGGSAFGRFTEEAKRAEEWKETCSCWGAGEAACSEVTLEWTTKESRRGGAYIDFIHNIICVATTREEHWTCLLPPFYSTLTFLLNAVHVRWNENIFTSQKWKWKDCN